VNPFEHTCASRQRSKKVKNATKAWICDKVMDWVRDKPDIGAKELQNRLLQTHFVEINYKRVHAGYQLALDKVYGDWKNSLMACIVGKLRWRRGVLAVLSSLSIIW
jgi:hypothetical protein